MDEYREKEERDSLLQIRCGWGVGVGVGVWVCGGDEMKNLEYLCPYLLIMPILFPECDELN